MYKNFLDYEVKEIDASFGIEVGRSGLLKLLLDWEEIFVRNTGDLNEEAMGGGMSSLVEDGRIPWKLCCSFCMV